MKHLAILAALVIPAAFAHAEGPPKGWWAAPTEDYAIGLDETEKSGGKPSVVIRSLVENPKSFIALNQTISAEDFRGKRVRLAGKIKTRGVAKWAGFWMRADGPEGSVLAFDNMQNRGISGTADWSEGTIVLDIPKDAETLHFGFILDGKGTAWASALAFGEVDASVPVTNARTPEISLPRKPVNLDFAE